jgi:hypothetical protein
MLLGIPLWKGLTLHGVTRSGKLNVSPDIDHVNQGIQ